MGKKRKHVVNLDKSSHSSDGTKRSKEALEYLDGRRMSEIGLGEVASDHRRKCGFGDTTRIQSCLNRWQNGDASARDELLERSQRRLRQLAAKMLSSFPSVHAWEEVDDLVNAVNLRLTRALARVRPDSVDDFMRWATCQLRRQLLDWARKYKHLKPTPAVSDPPNELAAATSGPATLAQWAEFHEAIGKLNPEETELFDLLYYGGLTLAEAGTALGISESTVKRRWRAAKLSLHKALHR